MAYQVEVLDYRINVIHIVDHGLHKGACDYTVKSLPYQGDNFQRQKERAQDLATVLNEIDRRLIAEKRARQELEERLYSL